MASSRPTNIKVMEESVSHTTELGNSIERNKQILFNRWKPTVEQIQILERLFENGERNPNSSRVNEITNMLKVHGNVRAKNVSYWFQNSHSRNKRKEQKNLVRGLPLNQKKIATSYQAPIRSSQQNVCSTPIMEPSVGLPQFLVQPMANTRQFESSIAVDTEQVIAVEINRESKKQKPDKNSNHLYFINQTDIAGSSNNPNLFSFTNAYPTMPIAPVSQQAHRFTNSPVSGSEELLDLFPLHPDGNIRSQERPEYYDMLRNLGGSEAAENKKKEELLVLFPLHPDCDLRSPWRRSPRH